MASPLSVRIAAGVATLTLQRAKIHNAFDDVLIAALIDALREIENDEDVRVVVLTGSGSSFSAGPTLRG